MTVNGDFCRVIHIKVAFTSATTYYYALQWWLTALRCHNVVPSLNRLL